MKKLKELTIKDSFMFGAVMSIPENCKGLLELILHKKIGQIIVSKEKSIVYHPEYKGVRLDVYAKDEVSTHYNVEMQVLKKPALGKRSRYYQSQMDMELLLSGADYGQLPNTYIIFICDFDPFGQKKYCYTFQNQCEESKKSKLEDGRCIIFLSTCGENEDEVPKELVSFLNFVRADVGESAKEFEDDYVQRLQDTILHIKANREMEERFMILEEMLRDERLEGERRGMVLALQSVLQKYGQLPDELLEKFQKEEDLEVLTYWVRVAAEVNSLEEFVQKVQ
ncbi:MAG: Rpn family recombination-promoting nuclease/putative transposase [Lachnospiraceae bacterium]|nr:Rpn family recombination-promoting nuclease/putative transposase [Lachnospiraceae bacterium]